MSATLVVRAFVVVSVGLILSLPELGFARGAQPMPNQTSPAATGRDAATEQALRQTQQGLTNPAERENLLKVSPAAQAHDAKVKTMLGNQSEGAYQLSSQLMETLVQKTGGDPAKMQELVNQMMSNPQMIEQYLTPAQRDQIRKMAGDIESQKGHTPTSGSGR